LADKGEACVVVEIMKTDCGGRGRRRRDEETGRAPRKRNVRSKGERIGRSETRSEKVRKGSVVLFGSCVAEAPTGRCYAETFSLGPAGPPRGRFLR